MYRNDGGIRAKEDANIVSIRAQRWGRSYDGREYYNWLVISQNQLALYSLQHTEVCQMFNFVAVMVANRCPFLETRSPRSSVSSSCVSFGSFSSPNSVRTFLGALAAKTRGVPNGQYMAPTAKSGGARVVRTQSQKSSMVPVLAEWTVIRASSCLFPEASFCRQHLLSLAACDGS